jgi:hypothetical protein
MNSATDSTDFLIQASLEAVESAAVQGAGLSPTATRCTGPITVGRTTQIKARAFSNGDWSAVTEATFTVEATD